MCCVARRPGLLSVEGPGLVLETERTLQVSTLGLGNTGECTT